MKRKYSSPAMEVEVFEASEYVAACYECYNPAIGKTFSDESQRGIKYPDLYVDKNGNGKLELDIDTGVSGDQRCYGVFEKHKFNVNPDQLQVGFWNANISIDGEPDASEYMKVDVIYSNGKYHIVKNSSKNPS
ncbi:hypothetical protein [Intestinibacter bartlettii]|uniref:Uncharacterized protein n=1 Tax=Intestinibacter bartlettii TaxID=261299 RepID=A0ABS6DXH4_9FIRM|nr:hypothetical protein [Intestinibacter bartlettii]MBU5336551.1 hypothetical protein [Intestinibacter bartlettii]